MPPKQCYSNRAYLRHMVYFSFPPVVTLSDGDLSNELLLCTHSVVSFIGDDRCINYFSKFIFFVTLSGGTYLFRSICLFVNVPLCLMATLTLSISHNSTAHGITVKFTSFGLCLSLENKFCFY